MKRSRLAQRGFRTRVKRCRAAISCLLRIWAGRKLQRENSSVTGSLKDGKTALREGLDSWMEER